MFNGIKQGARMRLKKFLLDLFFLGFCPLAAYFAPVSPVSPALISIVLAFVFLWFGLRLADFVERPRKSGLIGEVLR